MAHSSEDKSIIRYLLGEASQAEQASLEERYFADDEFFEQLLAIEDELSDAYVRGEFPAGDKQRGRSRVSLEAMKGELSASDKERFERLYLSSPERRQQVEFAKELIEAVSERPEAARPEAAARSNKISWWQSTLNLLRGQHPALRIAFAIILLAIVPGGSWLLYRRMQPPGERQQIEVERAARTRQEQELQQQQIAQQGQRPNDQLDESRQRESGQEQSPREQLRPVEQASRDVPRPEEPTKRRQPRPVIASFVLTPGVVRDTDKSSVFWDTGKSNDLTLARGVDVVRLQVYTEEVYPRYSAALETVEGRGIWSRNDLKARATPRGRSIVMKLPISVFSGRDYILTLRGTTAAGDVEVVEEYSFRVVKK